MSTTIQFLESSTHILRIAMPKTWVIQNQLSKLYQLKYFKALPRIQIEKINAKTHKNCVLKTHYTNFHQEPLKLAQI